MWAHVTQLGMKCPHAIRAHIHNTARNLPPPFQQQVPPSTQLLCNTPASIQELRHLQTELVYRQLEAETLRDALRVLLSDRQ